MAERVRATRERCDGPKLASSPDTVAKKIVKAATASHPKPRYPVGRGAGTIVRSRKVLGDRTFDAVIKRMYL